ncbi:MAG: histidinol phosphatase, partial [Spirochaetaceae bacterium]|nr:histidinol phosphatase [Spirochaetaceae bacterium]
NELPDYVREIEEVQEKFSDINIYKGLECEYVPEFLNFYIDELIGRYGMQYLVAGAHYFPYRGEWINCYGADNSKKHLMAYTDYVIKSIDCDLFSFIAHPDLFANFYLQWDDESIVCSKAILEAAVDKARILEINGYGFRKALIQTPSGNRRPYPLDQFWSLAAEYNISVIINSDAHKPDDVDHFSEALELAEKLGLTMKGLNI